MGLRATSGCISPSKSKSTFLVFKSSIASLTCFVFLDKGFPNVEWDKNATFGSKPNNFATLTLDKEIFTKSSADGKSFTCVSAIKIVFFGVISMLRPNKISPGLGSTTLLRLSIDAA